MATADAMFHVLAVDDSLIDRKLIERLLKTSSFKVTAVDSGSKALEFLVTPRNHQELEVNLVITDYCMPGMTGYDLLKKMKESSFLRDIPVVIMSSENVPSRINRCLEEGAEEFLLKPVRLSDVNKLRPHIMKSKHREFGTHSPENQESGQKFPNQPPEPQEHGKLKKEEEGTDDLRSGPNNNKRKTVDDGHPPDRTARPRYSDLTVMSN